MSKWSQQNYLAWQSPRSAAGYRRNQISDLLLWRHRAHPGDDVVKIGIGHMGVIPKAHRPIELLAVLVDALGDGALDLGVGPTADPFGLARSNIARHRNTPRTGKLLAAGAHLAQHQLALFARGMTLHAVADSGEIETAFNLVFQIGGIDRLLGPRDHLLLHRHVIDRRRHLVAHRLDALDIGHDRIEIGRQKDSVKFGRHDRDRLAVLRYAGEQELFDIGRAPGPYPRLFIRRDVRRRHVERARHIEPQPT